MPNEWQAKTISHVMDSISVRKSETFLLYGVTGSGKTAVYLELAEQCISLGRSVLLLAPEVGIAVKLRRDAREYGLPVLLYHGYQSPRQKEICFRTCAALTEPKLIIGTRSALFLPLRGIGLIILDEEHDDSFKQDERLPYHAKELAWFRARSFAAPLVLGSATPDIKTFHAASEGRYPLLRLPSRAGGGEMPEIRFIDTRHARGTLSPEAVLALKDNTAQGNQSIIMLNRRGYSPLMFCLDCGKAYKCPNCDISLTYHKSRGQLVCHYCGHASPFPAPCPTCKGSHYLPMGEGTEKLEESLRTLTDAKILRLDRDTSRREGRLEEILNAFAHREADILVGTQMLSKGHHFPDVTLVLIADADVGLNMPDYRAAERTFQLLTQAAGRAGRGKKKGIVLVQTRDPGHYCWDFIRSGDYEGFYRHEIALRQKNLYPPFIKMALVRSSWEKDDAEAENAWRRFAAEMKNAAGRCAAERPAAPAVIGMHQKPTADFLAAFANRREALSQGGHGLPRILGPSPAPHSFINGRHRAQIVIKAADWNSVRSLYAAALNRTSAKGRLPGSLRISLDLDPVNML
ncbi:MAG: primosomal protein N' [Mailhella sp.]|nr:primosomal protein N' [Mailhella sp.]